MHHYSAYDSRDVADARESFESSFEDFAERRFDYSTSAATNTIEIVRAFRPVSYTHLTLPTILLV